ncbi:putative biotin--[acetyl-CoA-carboxylase] ligase [Mycobacterium kansasii]|uniref:Putative biotin--[acetyl-CoA-carboxylase] ligase n=1 Tax=Mycobacterium kansasii TaxID=1768 RepID=A0A1V3WAB2_MYCKA|nr:putative biotin--[acetyl-CoA-carboxylase] ligase [Mycobacterium kansasii]
MLAGSAAAMGKLAGILAEVAQPFAVIGVGLNVTQDPRRSTVPGRRRCSTSAWRLRTGTS